jgi:hypothetical protein
MENEKEVDGVLLVDGWHSVRVGTFFTRNDRYEFTEVNNDSGLAWKLSGPATAIQAVRRPM